MENGCNYFKRTKPILGGEVVEKGGTVYLGDGNFGSQTRTCFNPPDFDESKFVKRGPQNHFWWVNQRANGVTFKAIEIKANLIDEFFIPLNGKQVFKSEQEALKMLGFLETWQADKVKSLNLEENQIQNDEVDEQGIQNQQNDQEKGRWDERG